MLNPPTRYVDPTGKLQEQPQTGRNIGNNVLAAVLSGMMTPTAYRQGAYGPVVDSQATAATAFAAGKQQKTEQSEQAQKLSDDMQARKLSTVKNNVDAMHLWAATSHEMGQDAQQQVDNYAPMLQIAQEHDQHLLPGDTKAVLATGMTMAEALKHPEFKDAMTKHSIVPDGVIQVPDDQGHLVPTQTFSVIDPNVQASMTQEAADIAGKINPAWKTAFEGSNGSMKMRLGQIQAITNQVNSVQYAERVFQDAAKSDDPAIKALGLKGDINGELMSAVRSSSRGSAQALKSLAIMENAKAAGGSTIDALDRLINDPDARAGSQYVLEALGTTADKVAKFVRDARLKQESELALAKEGGIGEKAPATADAMQAYENSRQSLPAEQRNDFLKPPEKGWTQGQLEKEQQRVDAQKHDNVVDSQAAADPAAVAQLTNLTIGAGDLTAGKELFTGNRAVKGRIAYDLASAQLASSIGLNPIHYTAAAMQAKQNKFNEYTSTKNGSIGSNLNSYQTFLLHNADAIDASNEWRRSNAEFWNTPLNELEKKFGNDPSYIKFKASLIAPDKEFMSFLNGGHAETVEDAKAASDLTNVNMPPSRILAAMQQLAKTADDRAATLGDQYVGVVGTTYPNLLNPTSQAILKTLGIKSRAAAFTGELPRNPAFVVNPSAGTLKPITDPNIARRFLAAASNSPDRAIEIAREHGWTLRP